MYRENKYGEKVDVNKYECGSCKYYLFELNWNPSFQFASLSSDLANRLHK